MNGSLFQPHRAILCFSDIEAMRFEQHAHKPPYLWLVIDDEGGAHAANIKAVGLPRAR
jgi:hypothetical protein